MVRAWGAPAMNMRLSSSWHEASVGARDSGGLDDDNDGNQLRDKLQDGTCWHLLEDARKEGCPDVATTGQRNGPDKHRGLLPECFLCGAHGGRRQ